MRGYISGGLWALILGGVAVAAVSYLDDAGALSQRGPVLPAAEAPYAQVDIAVAPAGPATDEMPRTPFPARAPFVDTFVPVLINSARLPELPLVDGDSDPAIADGATEPASEPASAPDPAPQPAPEPQAMTAPVPDAEPTPDVAVAEAPAVTVMPAADLTPPATDQTATAETQSAPEPAETGVVINRPGAEPAETAGQPAEVIEDTVIADDAPALLRFAAPFENPDNLPVLAILLIDGGAIADPVAAIAALGFAPTVVVSALAPNPADQLQAYRAAGAEVAMELALPTGALPADVEVAFEAALGLMPQSAMLYSPGGDAVQGDRQVTAQVIEVLAANGMGFVAQERGLGSAIRNATQAGVPAVAVARDLDGSGESAAAILRALDQAAFRARQSGDAVLLARLNDQTLAALRDWAAANVGSGTAIGPVSAVLLDAN